ncbi:TolC family protein [Paraneptunicella aestuarii]|uniref:TolC family protein n=1 Tax=Paraneptunicella aestuarii TaxID=2831148 RepID=UPI001E315ED6|nr:TolC family protein [Paraneptunicella aestuarii]UAA39067.1 TolC family protein [Paraneptunicella aestuarii]
MSIFIRVCIPKKPIASRFLSGAIMLLVAFTAMGKEDLASPSSLTSTYLTMSDAITLTLEHHPELRAFVSRKHVYDGLIQQAGVGERAQLGMMVEDALGTGQHSALKSMQTSLTFSWLLQQEQLDSRVDVARTEAEVLQDEQHIAVLDLAAYSASQYIQILVNQERLRLGNLAVSQAKDVVNAISKRVAVGKSSAVEMQLAEVELVRKELAVEDLEHILDAGMYQLSSQWQGQSKQYQLNGDLLSLPEIPVLEVQLSKLKDAPHIRRLLTEQRIAESKITLARIEQKPQWQMTAGVRRYEASDDFGLVAGISIPWGQSNRNAGEIAALKAQKQVLATEQDALMQKLDAQLYVLLQEMAHSRHVIDTVRTRVIPLLESALKDANRAFDLGQINYSQWSEVRRELIAAQSRLLDTYESLHLQHIEIQRLTGTSLPL